MLAMLRVFFMHYIVCIMQMLLLTPCVLVAMIVIIVPAMDMLVTVQPGSMMEILRIPC